MNLVWTVINVIILFLLIKKFLFKPVNNILEKRQQEAEDVLSEATAKQKEADDLKKQYDDSLKQLELDKEKSLEEAHNTRKKSPPKYNLFPLSQTHQRKLLV